MPIFGVNSQKHKILVLMGLKPKFVELAALLQILEQASASQEYDCGSMSSEGVVQSVYESRGDEMMCISSIWILIALCAIAFGLGMLANKSNSPY